MSTPIDEQVENQEKLSLGTLLLLDSFNRAGKNIESTSSSMEVLQKSVMKEVTVRAQGLGLMTNVIAAMANQARATTLGIESMMVAMFQVTKALQPTISGQEKLHDTISGLIDGLESAGIDEIFDDILKNMKDNFVTLETSMIESTGNVSKKTSKIGPFFDGMMGSVKSGFLSPIKAIPLQIGTLLVKPLTRLLDPFFETLEMLTLLTEPFVGLLEIFFAPLQEVIGIIAGDLAQSLLGNEDMIRDVTTAGQSLASVFLLTWEMFKPLLPLLVDGLRVFAQLITALAPLLQLLLLPLQALGAWLSSFMPSSSSTTYNSTSINVSGSVITERQLQRTAMEGVM